jgi:hypothetical protein
MHLAVFELGNPEQGMRGDFLYGISSNQELIYKNYSIDQVERWLASS